MERKQDKISILKLINAYKKRKINEKFNLQFHLQLHKN